MKFEKILDEYGSAIKLDERLDAVKVTRAFSYGIAPTKLGEEIIALSIKEASFEPNEIGENVETSELRIGVDIYCPVKEGTQKIYQIFDYVFDDLNSINLSGIKAEKIEFDKNILANVLKTEFIIKNENIDN